VWLSHLQGPLNAGQISVGCALAYLDFRHDARNWRAGRAVLAEWFQGFAERPSMKATAPAG
jgi:glutathione S-transferase